ncbi:sensor histidine kinase [Streptomyces gougerotii]|uniref:sensor histidine kinase n=1 Tax=Streptomyces gougerotii TaxID=53448 RepID=UPI00386D73AF|nr:sensor histidine kinase [Streptomyces gougerotii]
MKTEPPRDRDDKSPRPSGRRGLLQPGSLRGALDRAGAWGRRTAALPAVLSSREELRSLGLALGTPADSARPLLSRARSPWIRRLPHVLAFGAVAALLPVTTTVLVQDYGMNGALAGAFATAQTAPLLLAVSRPVQAWWVIFTADVVAAVVMLGVPGLDGRSWPWTPMNIVGYQLLMVCLGLRAGRRTLLAVWLATGCAGLFFEVLSQEHSDGSQLLVFTLSGALLLLSATLRERGDAQRKLVEQETISEAERSYRTLLEERNRIARELHDVVAHHMSLITVQADSAPYRIPQLDEAAAREFSSIADSARESLKEMRRVLSVLRSENAEGERTPQPGLRQLSQLVDATVRAGVPVTMSRTEVEIAAILADLPASVDLSLYRIVQEALANVVRHAPEAPTTLSVHLEGAYVTVIIVNGPGRTRRVPLEATGTGHGLVGMRERVRLVGGTLDTGPLPGGGFRVAARLPRHEKEPDSP